MKKLLLLCLLIDCSIASAMESTHARNAPPRSTPRVLEYHPTHRATLPEGADRSRWVQVLRDAFQPLRHPGTARHGARATPPHERAGAGHPAGR